MKGKTVGVDATTLEANAEVVEAALAHTVQNPTEAAYARSDLFERRRRLMDDWASYLRGTHGHGLVTFPQYQTESA